MKKTVLFVILDNYSDREYPLLADALQFGIEDKKSQYEVKTLSATKQAVRSIGGFTTIPDYCLEDVPSDYEGVVLIGGYSWGTDEARQFVPFVEEAYKITFQNRRFGTKILLWQTVRLALNLQKKFYLH